MPGCDMFNKRSMGQMRSMMGGGVPKGKLVTAMLEILVQLPVGTADLKNVILQHLGFMASMASSRDISAAWNDTKKKAAKEYPDKFILNERGILHWNDGSEKVLDKKISATNFNKLNMLAESEHCSTNDMITKLIKNYKQSMI